ncbi:MAG TPA: hypothetical protein VKV73_26860 [Chloroflexota bacterium]|nr:hypothetical protein [Chloroflexota bacterium]
MSTFQLAGSRAWTWQVVLAGVYALVSFTVLVVAVPVLLGPGIAITGGDAGNWLAIGQELMGAHVKAASVIYPPMVPGTIQIAQFILDPVVAARVVGVASLSIAGAGFVFAFRALLGARLTIIGAIAFTLCGWLSETFVFGGYPQIVGTGTTLAGVAALVGGLLTNRTRLLLLAAGAFAATVAASYTAIVYTTTIYGVAFILVCLFHRHWRQTLRNGALTAVAIAVSSSPFVPIYWQFAQISSPYLDPNPTLATAVDQYLFAVSDAPLLWSLMYVLATYAPIPLWRSGRKQFALTLVSIQVGSIVAFLVMHFVPRMLLPLNAWGIVGCLVLIKTWVGRLTPDAPVLRQVATMVVAGALCLVIADVGVARFKSAAAWYGSMTHDEIVAMEWLKANSSPGTLTATSPTRDGFQLAWWVEGLAQRRSYATADFRFLNVAQERRDATVAREIFATEKPEDAASLAALYGVQYLIIDRKAQLGAWPAWLSRDSDENALDQVFVNSAVRVLRISDTLFKPRRVAIAEVYRQLLGHAPDYSVLVKFDESGADLSTVVGQVFCSPESVQLHEERRDPCDRIGQRGGAPAGI